MIIPKIIRNMFDTNIIKGQQLYFIPKEWRKGVVSIKVNSRSVPIKWSKSGQEIEIPKKFINKKGRITIFVDAKEVLKGGKPSTKE